MSDETTPLLTNGQETRRKPNQNNVVLRILLCAFLVSLSFSFTQVPILYVFRLMTCDEYYKVHPPFSGSEDRCAVNAIESSTARSLSLLGVSTTMFGKYSIVTQNNESHD